MNIHNICIHKVGNSHHDEPLLFSEGLLSLDEDLQSLLTSYFINPFKQEEYFQFMHSSDLSMNEAYTYVSAIFDNPEQLHEQSIHLAKHLYEQSTHPKIKGGEFYVVYFKNCVLDGELLDAVGLFKSENKDTFLKVYLQNESFEVESQQGININKLDKGCLIFNTDKDSGYTVAVVDNTNKGAEARYWIDDFLQLKQREDEYFNTHSALSMYKTYVTKQLPEEFDINKVDQADMLNRSIDFFKEKDEFVLEEFSQEVLQQPEVINSFTQFKQQYEEERDVAIADQFTISDSAYKKQKRVYKSVIKLDKNFHIYVHGDREKIEQGEDDKGKFYKIYFNEEN